MASCCVLFLVAGLLSFPSFAYAAGAEGVDWQILSKIADKFRQTSFSWSQSFGQAASSLFKILTILSIVMFGITNALKRKPLEEFIAEFALLLVTIGFMFYVLNSYDTIVRWLLEYFSRLAGTVGAPEMNPGAVLAKGMEVIEVLLKRMSFFSPGESVGLLLSALVLIIIFALIAAQMLLVMCEVYVCVNAGVILLGFGAFDPVRSYAINFLRYTLSGVIKLFTMQLVVGIGIQFIRDIKFQDSGLPEQLVLIGSLIVLLALVQNLPDMVAGIVNGAHVGSAGALNSAVRTVAVATAATAAAVRQSAAKGSTAMDAYSAARQMGGGLREGAGLYMDAGKNVGVQSNHTLQKEWIETQLKNFKMSKNGGQ